MANLAVQSKRISIHRIVDLDLFAIPLETIFPDGRIAALNPFAEALADRHVDFAAGKVLLTIQSHLLRFGGKTVLIDTCVGEHKARPLRPEWHERSAATYLANLAAAGCAPQDIDIVMCTHLHADHVGWNTRLESGRWVPTFPNARYVFSRKDFEFFGRQTREAHNREAYIDSVLPVVDAGLADIVDSSDCVHREIGDGIWLEDAAGHSPGSVVVNAQRGGSRAAFMGDIIHHPIQLVRPDIPFFADEEPSEACATRQRLLAQCADNESVLYPAHFPDPAAGRVHRAKHY